MPDIEFYRRLLLEWEGWYQGHPKDSYWDAVAPLVKLYKDLSSDEQRKFREAYASALAELWPKYKTSLAFIDEVDCPEAGPTIGRMLAEFVRQLLSNPEDQWVRDDCGYFVRAAERTRSEAAVPALRLLIENAAGLPGEGQYNSAMLALTRIDYRLVLPYLRRYVAWLAQPSQPPTDTAGAVAKYEFFWRSTLTDIIAECIRQGGPFAVGDLTTAMGPLDAEEKKAVLAALGEINLWPEKNSGARGGIRYRMSTAGRCALRSWMNDLEAGDVLANA